MLQMINEAATYSNNKLESVASQKAPRLCKEAVQEQLGFLFSFEYGRHYVSEQRRSSVLEMLENIRHELDSLLLSMDWLEENTKIQARKKLANLKALVAYPDEFLNGTLLNDITGYSETTNFAPDSYLSNMLTLRKAEFKYDATLLHTSYKELSWIKFKDSASVNAFQENAFNSINILAGILNDQLYDETRPEYLNYAIIGSVIGHELVHSFDSRGIRLDSNSDWRIWWDIDSQVSYEKRLDCTRLLYDKLQIPKTFFSLNGTRTLDENMADLVGLRLAHKAYQKLINDKSRNKKENLKLPELEQFNGKQLFWLSYGTNWCSGLSPEAMAKRYNKDVHSPEPMRVNVPLQNLPEFANDFNCPLGSQMNLAQKRVDCDLF